MAVLLDDFLTVRQVMSRIKARAKSTVTRLIADGTLEAVELPGHGWLVTKTSVEKFLERDAASDRKVGFPRGKTRGPRKAKATKRRPSR